MVTNFHFSEAVSSQNQEGMRDPLSFATLSYFSFFYTIKNILASDFVRRDHALDIKGLKFVVRELSIHSFKTALKTVFSNTK